MYYKNKKGALWMADFISSPSFLIALLILFVIFLILFFALHVLDKKVDLNITGAQTEINNERFLQSYLNKDINGEPLSLLIIESEIFNDKRKILKNEIEDFLPKFIEFSKGNYAIQIEYPSKDILTYDYLAYGSLSDIKDVKDNTIILPSLKEGEIKVILFYI